MHVFAEPAAEVGTIAGIASAVAMALVGAISSYISYQKKKLCFGIQRKASVPQNINLTDVPILLLAQLKPYCVEAFM